MILWLGDHPNAITGVLIRGRQESQRKQSEDRSRGDRGERQKAGRFEEDAPPLALTMEQGSVSQGKQVALEAGR